MLLSGPSSIVEIKWLARPVRKASIKLPADMPRTLPAVFPTTAMVSLALVRLSACKSRPLRKRRGLALRPAAPWGSRRLNPPASLCTLVSLMVRQAELSCREHFPAAWSLGLEGAGVSNAP